MTVVLILNIVLSILAFGGILALLGWGIVADRAANAPTRRGGAVRRARRTRRPAVLAR